MKEIQEIRKNPVFILSLKEVNRTALHESHEFLKKYSFDELDVVLQTKGGSINSAFLFVKLFKRVADKINIIVPLYAKSAGTLICLGGDKIFLTYLSELGPLDTQLKEYLEEGQPVYTSALNGFKVLEEIQKHTLDSLDKATTLILARSDMRLAESVELASKFVRNTSGKLYTHFNSSKFGEHARELEVGERYGKMVLTRYKNWPEEKAKATIKKLVYGYPAHDFIIDKPELEALGLPVDEFDMALTDLLLPLGRTLRSHEESIIELFAMEQNDPRQKKKKQAS